MDNIPPGSNRLGAVLPFGMAVLSTFAALALSGGPAPAWIPLALAWGGGANAAMALVLFQYARIQKEKSL